MPAKKDQMNDLWGNETNTPEPHPIASGKRKPTRPNGYAAQPGTGPRGETCGGCEFKVIKRMGGAYRKCYLAKDRWTGGPGSDILARSPACVYWKPKIQK